MTTVETNVLPTFPGCPHGEMLDETCSAAAKARWDKDSVAAYDQCVDALAEAWQDYDGRLDRYNAMTCPDGWSPARWLRRKGRVLSSIDGMFAAAVKEAHEECAALYLDANYEYLIDMASCCRVV